MIQLVGLLRLTNWHISLEVYLLRLLSYFSSISKDLRIQVEAVLIASFLFFLYFSFMIASFDDDQEETLEYLSTIYVYIFLFLFLLLLYRYSLHYFSFLQASELKGKYTHLLSQIAQDFINTFAPVSYTHLPLPTKA